MSTTVKCRAKDPANCSYPGHKSLHAPVQGKVEDIQQFFNVELPSISENVTFTGTPATLTRRAMRSSLSWKGAKPKWWNKFYEESASNPLFPSQPELLDIVDSPAGKLAVVWQPENQDKNEISKTLDSGIGVSTCYYKSVETGETLGYIKMASITDNSSEQAFGNDEFTPFRWSEGFNSKDYGFNDHNFNNHDHMRQPYGYRNLTGDDLLQKRREVWVKAQKNLGQGFYRADGKYVYSVELGSEYFPDDVTVQKDLKKFSRILNKDIKNKKEYYKNPYVEFSRVEKPLKGQGFGTALYVYTGRRLAQNNQVLVASGVQSNDAEKTWGNFRKHLKGKVSSIELDYNGKKKMSPVLDFRS